MLSNKEDSPEPGFSSERELRATGGSMAVGVIDGVVTVKELIEGIIQDAEKILKSRRWGVGPMGEHE